MNCRCSRLNLEEMTHQARKVTEVTLVTEAKCWQELPLLQKGQYGVLDMKMQK